VTAINFRDSLSLCADDHPMSTARSYEGSIWNELDTAAAATRWKTYWSGKIREFIGETVLEVGAGIGTNTPYLCGSRQKRWVCVEPDSVLVERIPQRLAAQPWAGRIETKLGILQDLPPDPVFDTILYIDVLEHIEHDHDELRDALARLKSGGHIVVISPAYPFLYTGFDEKLGHYRRYTKASLRACSPPGAPLRQLYHLDAMGLFASLANRLVLHQSKPPTLGQVLFWDGWLVTTSRLIDPLIGFSAGKSIVAIWMKD
jgi:SAM-dependent methyltransferase